MPLWAKVLYRYGVPSAIALFLVWFVSARILKTMEDMKSDMNGSLKSIGSEVHDHVFQTGYYMHAMCVMTAKQSGQPASLCENPPR